MILEQISILNYKNCTEAQYHFDAHINCFVGRNGIGKTNILDAIFHLSYGKSYFNPVSVQNIQHGADFFVLDGTFIRNERKESIICSLKKGTRKVIKRNGKAYERLAEHVGLIPVVIISPSDSDLIQEGSEARRSFMDSIIAQNDPTFLQNLMSYQKIIAQRNALLKYFALNHTFDTITLEVYNDQLTPLAQNIHEKRNEFISEFNPIFQKYHQYISEQYENVLIRYESQLHERSLSDLLKEQLQKDRTLQYTSTGIHKDDLTFLIEHDYPIKKYGSQGQQKTFLIALKLAQFDFLKQKSKTTPILLLDDIFDKLDENRVKKIISLMNEQTFGQLFISDTHRERTESILIETQQSYKLFELQS